MVNFERPAVDASMRRYEGKIFLVVGGASGIGAAIAERFEAEGAVAVVRADIATCADELVDDPRPRIHIDVARQDSVDHVIDAVIRRYGRLDGLVNSAAVARVVPFLDTSVDEFCRTLDVNLRGAFLLARKAARQMMRQGQGVILQLGSVSGAIGNEGRAAYGMSKAGLAEMSKALAAELSLYGVRVNVLAPGPVKTPLAASAHSDTVKRLWVERVPLHRYGEPEEMASAAAFLCSDDARGVSGHVLVADGGFLSAGLQPQSL